MGLGRRAAGLAWPESLQDQLHPISRSGACGVIRFLHRIYYADAI